MVIAVEKKAKIIQLCAENLAMFKPEKNINVELINSDFLNLECGDYGFNRADMVFINPNLPFTRQEKPNIF